MYLVLSGILMQLYLIYEKIGKSQPIYKKIFFLLFLNFMVCNAQEQPSSKLRSITESIGIITAFSATCVANHISLHHIGHNLALKYLDKNHKGPSFIEMFAGHSNCPRLGRTEENIYFVAGPLLQLLVNYGYYKIMDAVAHKHPIFNGCKYGAVAGMAQAIATLMPFKLYVPTTQHCIKSDGYYLLKNLDYQRWFLRKYLKSFKE